MRLNERQKQDLRAEYRIKGRAHKMVRVRSVVAYERAS
jgi:hypothetical protein